ncbi:MAG: hypothetical protein ACPIOQ_22845, partial [Promethearchaeia archaeon]
MPEDEVPSGAGGSGDQVADGDEHAAVQQAGRWDQVCVPRGIACTCGMQLLQPQSASRWVRIAWARAGDLYDHAP